MRWFASADGEILGVVGRVDQLWMWAVFTKNRGQYRPVLTESALASEEFAVNALHNAMPGYAPSGGSAR